MLLCLCCLLAVGLCHGVPKKTVLRNTLATLPCPLTKGEYKEVTWTRYVNSNKVKLVTIKDGKEKIFNKRYGSLADHSLAIMNVTGYDSAMHFCNGRQIYLEVTTDPTMVEAGNVPVTPQNDGPGQEGAVGDAEDQQSSDFWKVPVGVVVGAATMLLAVLTLKFCSKKRAETTNRANVDKSVAEVIYEQIGADKEQPRREGDVESPYYWTSISETPNISTPPNNLYSTVNKLKTKGRSSEESVYSLAQNPPQTGNVSGYFSEALEVSGAEMKDTNSTEI